MLCYLVLNLVSLVAGSVAASNDTYLYEAAVCTFCTPTWLGHMWGDCGQGIIKPHQWIITIPMVTWIPLLLNKWSISGSICFSSVLDHVSETYQRQGKVAQQAPESVPLPLFSKKKWGGIQTCISMFFKPSSLTTKMPRQLSGQFRQYKARQCLCTTLT